jgi:hypothetical protein
MPNVSKLCKLIKQISWESLNTLGGLTALGWFHSDSSSNQANLRKVCQVGLNLESNPLATAYQVQHRNIYHNDFVILV